MICRSKHSSHGGTVTSTCYSPKKRRCRSPPTFALLHRIAPRCTSGMHPNGQIFRARFKIQPRSIQPVPDVHSNADRTHTHPQLRDHHGWRVHPYSGAIYYYERENSLSSLENIHLDLSPPPLQFALFRCDSGANEVQPCNRRGGSRSIPASDGRYF